MTPPRTPRPDFGDFHAPDTASQPTLDRDSFAGLGPEEAVSRIMDFLHRHQDLAEKTATQKRGVLKRMLMDFEKKGLDLGSVTADDAHTYRAYLLKLVDDEQISKNYASHVVVQWNAAMRAVFGETSRPGEGLIMRGFKQTPRKVRHLNEEDFNRVLEACRHKDFKTEHHRRLFRAYLELTWCAGARIGSLNNEKLRVCDVYWDRQTVHLRHMKNVEDHEVVLTDRALDALRDWVQYLQRQPCWRGRETPLLIGPTGKLATYQFYNNTMKQVAAMSGIGKDVSSHIIRKSAGTLIARQNPKLAQEQLGITAKIFDRHYNQPLLEDRVARRDILPGAAAVQSPAERIADAYLKFQGGRMTQAELDHVVAQARIQETEPRASVPDASYT